jgi:hypothetical protein
VFSSNLATPGVSFAAALRGNTAQQKQPQARQTPVAVPVAGVNLCTPSSGHQNAGQSVRASIVSNQPLDNILRVVTAVQQIMTDFNGAVSEEDK